ncbi:DegV family protein [Clostridium lundense]|uniref:DegV family protein n=1 Tax=Clostridium lundense TaxID=319475 RepID=UPI00048516B5|nr:DegV family protein [Clostridium lundense]
MNKFTIMTDSCCDLPIDFIERNNIPFVSLTCNFNEKEYYDDFGKSLSSEDFFNKIRQGEIPKTSQPSSQIIYEKFKELALFGNDIIYICVSSGLSGTLNSANIAKSAIGEEFPNTKIYIVDILTSSLGQGLMVIKAEEMRKNGASFEEIIDYLENIKQYLNTYITVDDLSFLKNGGRISSTAAILGTVLHIKPILTLNHEGRVIPVLKVKGRKKSINTLADIVKERIENPENETISICHGDCLDGALSLKNAILEKVKIKDVLINNIGPVVGSYSGPNALAVFFIGKHRQHHMIKN